eukprot:scaffold985_cov573-Prasinococcus_capsulatus_cf.AAC.7
MEWQMWRRHCGNACHWLAWRVSDDDLGGVLQVALRNELVPHELLVQPHEVAIVARHRPHVRVSEPSGGGKQAGRVGGPAAYLRSEGVEEEHVGVDEDDVLCVWRVILQPVLYRARLVVRRVEVTGPVSRVAASRHHESTCHRTSPIAVAQADGREQAVAHYTAVQYPSAGGNTHLRKFGCTWVGTMSTYGYTPSSRSSHASRRVMGPYLSIPICVPGRESSKSVV